MTLLLRFQTSSKWAHVKQVESLKHAIIDAVSNWSSTETMLANIKT
jgi:hypothetical protein